MVRLALAVLLLLAGPAAAEIARVRGGEHPDFTRIVVEAAELGDWRFGRNGDGYELALSPAVTGYDLSAAFDRIPRDRLSGLWRDAASGNLRLALSCACHAVAFEFRPGMVVIDVKSGAAPRGSAFEEPLAPAGGTVVTQEGAQSGYDWLAIRSQTIAAPPPTLASLPGEDGDLNPLRAALMLQISRGVARGVVELAEGQPAAMEGREEDTKAIAAHPGLRLAPGEIPGVVASGGGEIFPARTDQGAACLPDSHFAVAQWLPAGPVATLIGPARTGLVGEFDAPQAPEILRAARFHVALGFGAEARQILGLLPALDDEARILDMMGQLVDLEPLSSNGLAGQEGCDTSAALWAALALATGGDVPTRRIETGAVVRTFSALPVHLRQHLGPLLARLFTARNDSAAARAIRDAVLRAPGAAGAETALMDARQMLADGDAADAAGRAREVLRGGGGEAGQAAAVLTEAIYKGHLPASPDLAATVAAFLIEARGTPQEAALRRAHVLALALNGQYREAFSAVAASPETWPDLWSLAAEGAGDDDFLSHAMVPPPVPVGGQTARVVAKRLLALGFAQEALVWLDSGVEPSRESRLLAADAKLALRDARGAISLLADERDTEAEAIRGRALLQLGDTLAAAAAFERAGQLGAALGARRAASDWPEIAAAASGLWKEAAALVLPAPPVAAGPIAQATALADDTAAAITVVATLLDQAEDDPAP